MLKKSRSSNRNHCHTLNNIIVGYSKKTLFFNKTIYVFTINSFLLFNTLSDAYQAFISNGWKNKVRLHIFYTFKYLFFMSKEYNVTIKGCIVINYEIIWRKMSHYEYGFSIYR